MNSLKDNLDRFKMSYSKYPDRVIADSGYGSEENYDYMQKAGVEAYVKYLSFHQKQKRNYKKCPCHKENMVYEMQQDAYTCLHGGVFQHQSTKQRIGRSIEIKYYICEQCQECPFRVCKGSAYVPLERDGSQLLFQVISYCYEQRSVIITTNLEFSRWTSVFYDAQMTAALIDRLAPPFAYFDFT